MRDHKSGIVPHKGTKERRKHNRRKGQNETERKLR